ncbi:hypothetical protein JRI60_23895 [Archangium violaceum]|uniref:hypothetical protein n=1 Tax=Archangium violaceum TaxID=83451 RepID=UPI00194F2987|nr:hypothetical protein [Archangium violaceum]QRO01842.1 hypothetical protein JRI60_23895 [Archangium violaceum]
MSTTWIKLHVQLGDQKDPAERTEVELRLGETFPELAPPISPEESVAIREAFSWQRTSALPETNVEGHPSLYYFIVYLEDREQAEALDEMLIHHSPLPFFTSELARWDGQRGLFNHQGDGTGLFVFAIMPAVTYNLLRQAALDGDVMYRVIQPRDIPAEARGADGSISYEALRLSGFRYLDQDPRMDDLGTQEKPLFGRIIRKVVAAVVAVVKGVVRAVQQGIGLVDRWVTGSVDLAVALDLRNTDPAFGGRIDRLGGAGSSTPMQRAWGAGAGQQVRLPGVRVTARQRVLGGTLPTMFTAHTGDDGVARMKIARGRDTSICLSTENDAAQITQFVIEMEVCDFRAIPGTQLSTNTTYRLFLQHRLFNVLAQATEGRAYLREVVGSTPRKAEILVGFFAEFFRGSAVAPAFGYPNLAYDATLLSLIAVVGTRVPFAAPLLVAAWPTYAVDIILPTSDGPGFDHNFDSRGLVTHEYGHFAMASLLYAQGVQHITGAYFGAVVQRTREELGNPSPDEVQAGYINEAFADFFSSQVAGGTNYYRPNFESSPTAPSTNHCGIGVMEYCQAQGTTDCVEINELNTGDFFARVNGLVTLFHDAFDGWSSGANRPGNGRAWGRADGGTARLACVVPPDSTLVYTPSPVRNGEDEEIHLAGGQIRNMFRYWDARSNRLSEDSVLGALADTMRESNYNWCQRCALFALHEPGYSPGMSQDQLNSLCQQSRIANWIGPPPSGGCGGTATHAGMTWRVLDQNGPYILVGSDTQTDPYNGDTNPTASLPLLCLNQDGRPAPPGIPFDFFNGWAAGEVRLTPPIPGSVLTSPAAANAICVREFGAGFRMAEFHDGGGGWHWWAEGALSTTGRFWVAINDQPANPWDP